MCTLMRIVVLYAILAAISIPGECRQPKVKATLCYDYSDVAGEKANEDGVYLGATVDTVAQNVRCAHWKVQLEASPKQCATVEVYNEMMEHRFFTTRAFNSSGGETFGSHSDERYVKWAEGQKLEIEGNQFPVNYVLDDIAFWPNPENCDNKTHNDPKDWKVNMTTECTRLCPDVMYSPNAMNKVWSTSTFDEEILNSGDVAGIYLPVQVSRDKSLWIGNVDSEKLESGGKYCEMTDDEISKKKLADGGNPISYQYALEEAKKRNLRVLVDIQAGCPEQDPESKEGTGCKVTSSCGWIEEENYSGDILDSYYAHVIDLEMERDVMFTSAPSTLYELLGKNKDAVVVWKPPSSEIKPEIDNSASAALWNWMDDRVPHESSAEQNGVLFTRAAAWRAQDVKESQDEDGTLFVFGPMADQDDMDAAIRVGADVIITGDITKYVARRNKLCQPQASETKVVNIVQMDDQSDDCTVQESVVTQLGIWRDWEKQYESVCDIEDIKCNADGRIYSIEVDNKEVNGQLPASIGALRELVRLEISHTHVSGRIPNSIGDLKKLQHLDLSHNQMKGEIPSTLANCEHLSYLFLNDNRFNGEVPKAIYEMEKLISLNLQGNLFTGKIPDLDGKKQWTELELFPNVWLCPIPDWVESEDKDCYNSEEERDEAEMPKSERLALKKFAEFEDMPTFVDPCTSAWGFGEIACEDHHVIELNLDHHESNKNIPVLADFPKLRKLSAAHSHLEKIADQAFVNANALRTLDLSGNEIDGRIPEFSSKIETINLSDNRFNGALPESVWQLKKLTTLRLENNYLTGPLPEEKPQIADLNLQNNLWNCPVPAWAEELNVKCHKSESSPPWWVYFLAVIGWLAIFVIVIAVVYKIGRGIKDAQNEEETESFLRAGGGGIAL